MLRTKRLASAILLAFGVSLSTYAASSLDPMTLLGDAKPFTVLELGEKQLEITSNSLIVGDVGKATDTNGGKVSVTGSTITGQIYGDPDLIANISNSGGTNVNTGGAATKIANDPGVLTGGDKSFAMLDTFHNPTFDPFVSQSMASAVSAAVTASGTAAAQTPDVTINSGFNLTSGTSKITGVGGGTVVEISGGNFIVDGASTILQLESGGPDDYFIINFKGGGDFNITSGAAIELLGDLEPSDVLWNIVDSGAKVELTGNAGSVPDKPIIGTFLAPNRGFNISSVETIPHTAPPHDRKIIGAIYGGNNGEGITITQSIIEHSPFMPMPSVIVPLPAAAWMGLVVLGGLGITKRFRRS